MGALAGIGSWLIAMTTPLVGKVLFALGFQVVTIAGMTVAITTVKNLWLGYLGAVPAAGLQLALLAGVGEGIGMILGAITFRLTMWQIQQSTKILGVNS
jgi:hypothetical protein